MKKGFWMAMIVSVVIFLGASVAILTRLAGGKVEVGESGTQVDQEPLRLATPSVAQSEGQPVVEAAEVVEEPLIGGQQDEHGCLGPAGYSFDEELGACIRVWELDDSQRIAAKLAIESVELEQVTVVEVMVAKCPGCFTVKLEAGRDRVNVDISNWEVVDRSLTPEDCLDLGGRTVNIVGGGSCEAGEENVGEVTGFISPNVCCVRM